MRVTYWTLKERVWKLRQVEEDRKIEGGTTSNITEVTQFIRTRTR